MWISIRILALLRMLHSEYKILSVVNFAIRCLINSSSKQSPSYIVQPSNRLEFLRNFTQLDHFLCVNDKFDTPASAVVKGQLHDFFLRFSDLIPHYSSFSVYLYISTYSLFTVLYLNRNFNLWTLIWVLTCLRSKNK